METSGEAPAPAAPRTRIVVALAVGLALLVVVGFTGSLAGDVGPCDGFDVIEFELAGSAADAREMLDDCPQPVGPSIDALRDGLDADSRLFVPAYVVSLVLFCVARGRLAPPSSRRGGAVLRLACVAAVAAGILDLIENNALQAVLDDPIDPGSAPAIAFGCAALKFALVAFALIVALGSLVALVRAARRATP